MFSAVLSWMQGKWLRSPSPSLPGFFIETFKTPAGQQVLRYWLDNIYCTVYQGTDPIGLATHNGRRSVIHEILESIDAIENPYKFRAPNVETNHAGMV